MLPRVLQARPRLGASVLLAVVCALVATGLFSARARGADVAEHCARFASQSVARAHVVTGSGERVVVIGDSWSAGLGLARPVTSWPSRLPGEVHVAGFSGSGFATHASPCGSKVSFGARADRALAGGADLVVVEGGLNDFDRTSAEITAGFERLMADVAPYRTVVVGPAAAPSRARQVPRVNALLRRLSDQYGVAYVSTADLRLPYLRDRLHLTPEGHQLFGDAVARADRRARLTAQPA